MEKYEYVGKQISSGYHARTQKIISLPKTCQINQIHMYKPWKKILISCSEYIGL